MNNSDLALLFTLIVVLGGALWALRRTLSAWLRGQPVRDHVRESIEDLKAEIAEDDRKGSSIRRWKLWCSTAGLGLGLLSVLTWQSRNPFGHTLLVLGAGVALLNAWVLLLHLSDRNGPSGEAKDSR